MVTSEDLRLASPSETVDLRDVPLAEILALGPDVIYGTVGRALHGRTVGLGPTSAFESAL